MVEKKTIKAWAIVRKENNEIADDGKYEIFQTKKQSNFWLKTYLFSRSSFKIVRCTITYEV